jgi:hypothetical protein
MFFSNVRCGLTGIGIACMRISKRRHVDLRNITARIMSIEDAFLRWDAFHIRIFVEAQL